MARGRDEVEFSVVAVHTPRQRTPESQPAAEPPRHDYVAPDGSDPLQALEAVAVSQGDGFDRQHFPLAGPILEKARPRELRGRCSQCDRRLRLKVRQAGPVRVTCPICGHQRTVDL